MKLKKYLAALLCAVLLLGAAILPQTAMASTTVYLLAVGNKMYDPPGGTLPVSVDGVIYIPYTVFDRNATGWDLGVYYGIDQSRGTVLTLYSADKRLVFTVEMGICEDQDGNSMNFRAVKRGSNNTPYVPASAVCKFFGLSYSFLPTSDRGTLIRIADGEAISIMNDSQFMAVAPASMLSRYNDIIQSMNPQPTPTPSPSPSAPVATEPPTPSGSGKENVRVYLALDASQATGDLTMLFPSGVRALFLFTPDSLPNQANLVRKAVAAGHSVGLLLHAGTEEEAVAQFEEGNELLTHIARVRTRMVAAPDNLVSALSEQGWCCWQANVTGANAAALLANLDQRRSVGRITLPADASLISQVVQRARSDGYDIRQPLETDM